VRTSQLCFLILGLRDVSQKVPPPWDLLGYLRVVSSSVNGMKLKSTSKYRSQKRGESIDKLIHHLLQV